MPDIKNIFKKIESNRPKKIEEIKDNGTEISKSDFENTIERRTEADRRFQEKFSEEASMEAEEASDNFVVGGAGLAVKKEREKKIEDILAKDMEKAYLSMSQEKQLEFKREGEKTAREINGLLDKTKVKVKKIISLIKKWLLLIPGVNKFFLEQESKIKADEIFKMK